MKRGDIPYYQNDNDPEDWDDNDLGPNFGNFRNERYNNAYRGYRGGWMDGTMNSGGFGPRNGGGFRYMNSGFLGPPRLIGPLLGNFAPGLDPRSLIIPSVPFPMGRGYGPKGPPPKINRSPRIGGKAYKFLLQCGVPREQIKNVPPTIMELMEPEQCGVCGLQFNSDGVARTHYLSKNHQKNQKKWLTQRKDGSHHSKEIPFKSRELYCELCDVHITSKAHADSHYAGKAHRAIIEGRKLPRNPLLLQRGMTYRLDQLIRREKKNVKAIDDTETKVETVREPRPFQTELYCKICKTSVTCSDQMTTHLNGKRHLSKEKQHILKTMKGENIDDKEGEKEDADEDDVEDSENEADKTEDGDDVDEIKDKSDIKGEVKDGDDYDWGKGSGTWDEPECQ